MPRAKQTKISEALSDAEVHHLIAGVLCLDFANTLNGHGKTPAHEYLNSYRDLVLWSRHVRILSEGDAQTLLRKATRQPNDALAVYHRAIALRETIFRFFCAVAFGNSPQLADLESLNSARLEALSHSHIGRAAKGFILDWDDQTALDRMLWQIAVSAAELITSDHLKRVRQCSGDTCDWLFVDNSRNHLRRWCSMDQCGNRAKVRRFFARKRRRAVRPRSQPPKSR